MNSKEARKMLQVYEPVEVAWTSKDGTKRDDDGDAVDERETVPHVMAFGPFGSWPETLEDAEKRFAKHDEWSEGKSLRLGRVVMYEDYWGFQATK